VIDHIVPLLTGPTGAFPDSLIETIKTQASVATKAGTVVGPSVTTDMDDTVNPIYRTVQTTGDFNVGSSGKTDAVCNFQNLWVQGNLNISNDVTFTCENLHVVGNLTISNVSSVRLGNTYVDGNVQLGTGGTSIIAPVFVVGGNFNISNGMSLGTSSSPSMLLMTNSTGTNQTFTSTGDSELTGVLANLSLGGATNLARGDLITGSVFSSGTVTMTGDAKVAFDANATGTWTTPTTTSSAAAGRSGTWQNLSPSGQ
jgi:hypothetical protein